MDEAHLIACFRYIENNPVRAKLVKQPEQWIWSSASAHIQAKDNLLVKVNPGLSIVQKEDWKQFLSKTESSDQMEIFRKHERTGRPLGNEPFVKMLEKRLNRTLIMKKPGQKAKN
jgi:putative transposase